VASQWIFVLVLGALPFLLVVVNGILARLLRLVGVDLGPQLTAIVIVLLLNGALAAGFIVAGGAHRLGDEAYVFLTANAMWFVYFQVFVNLSLTSLHARLMLQALWHGAVDMQSLAREYDSRVLLATRLDRLQKLRQIAIDAGVISLDWPYLLWLSYPLYWWRSLIRIEGESLQLSDPGDNVTRPTVGQ
jgi:hypothetical protein